MAILFGLVFFMLAIFFLVEVCIALIGFLWLKGRQLFCDHVNSDGWSWKFICAWFANTKGIDSFVFKCNKCGKEMKIKKRENE